MEWVETTGKSVEEAKGKALDQLGVAEEDAEITVLEEPKPGLFGRVRGEARVRARVRPRAPRPKAERRDRKQRAEASGGAARPARGAGRATSGRSASTAGAEGDGDETTTPSTVSAAVPAAVTEPGSSAASGRAPSARRGRRGRGGGAGAPTADRHDDEAADQARDVRQPARGRDEDEGRRDHADEREDTTMEQHAIDPETVGEEARRFVQGLVEAFGMDGTATVHRDGDDLEVRVDGTDLGLLVGPRGATLQAVQELTRVAAQRRLGDQDTRLRVDVGGYRERRREALGAFARQVAEQVIAERTAKRLEPMSSPDRKIVHDALAGLDGVVTRSEGEDPRRCVVIAPATA